MFTDTETVSVIDAAKRQLKEAITLFFEQRDSVAIHTLASAAHEILCKSAKPRGFSSFLRDIPGIDEKAQERVNSWMNENKNFFKHGNQNKNKDPKASIEFLTEMNVFII